MDDEKEDQGARQDEQDIGDKAAPGVDLPYVDAVEPAVYDHFLMLLFCIISCIISREIQRIHFYLL